MKTTTLLTCFILSITGLSAQTVAQIKQMTQADSTRLVEMFKDIHQNPELAFMEVRTSAIVAKELKILGYEVTTEIAKTGVVGIMKNGDGPVVMYRADMDCNPVEETTGLDYASDKTKANKDGVELPVMHACGHDAHVTWMLGAAKIMAKLKKEWSGTLVFLAQPAEEIGAGAKAMVNAGMFEKGVPIPDFLFGMHTIPLPVGQVDNAVGERMAGTDQIDVTFYGVSGHGASPEYTKDPIIMASSAVMQYQTIISRNIAASDVAVLTVGEFSAGNSHNVIPPSALLKVNLRWFNDSTRTILLKGIENINRGIAVANGLEVDMYPTMAIKASAHPLVNNGEMVARVNESLVGLLGENNIITNRPAVMVSEDFPYLVLGNGKTVYDFLFVGVANNEASAKAKSEGKKFPFYNHNSEFKVDLAAIPLGTEIAATALLELLKR